jgi:predicted small lipoprotein YifL
MSRILPALLLIGCLAGCGMRGALVLPPPPAPPPLLDSIGRTSQPAPAPAAPVGETDVSMDRESSPQ